jgi:hypothetical protein
VSSVPACGARSWATSEIQGVFGEEVLRGSRQQRDFGVEQGSVQAGDAVALAGGPPPAHPVSDRKPPKAVNRSRR